ncbi:hypothetical protein GE061_015578 [Apolygus lucorum]|uniref:PWWP domain-containing protein n=1 Tax=Apolygus lucorum TaxID=248454 RepID=A0A8S9XLG5_APOLU|nr:hypothetical protein GE061_015578 [Apolygus lucorum]
MDMDMEDIPLEEILLPFFSRPLINSTLVITTASGIDNPELRKAFCELRFSQMEDQDPGTSSLSEEEDDEVNLRFHHGSIVVAKLGRFPWWPAMVDVCPDTGDIYWLDDFEDLSKKNATHYNVVFFDVPGKVTRSWVHTDKIVHYRSKYPESLTAEQRETMQKMKGSDRRLMEARTIAEAALAMSIEDRKTKYSFMYNFKGKITLFDDDGNKQVIDGSKVGDAEKPAKKRKRSKSKNLPASNGGGKDREYSSEDAHKSEPVKIRKKPGPKPKPKTAPETTKKVAPIRIRKKPGTKQKNCNLPVEYETYTSQTNARRLSTASSTSTLPPETDSSTPKKTRKTRASYQIVPISPSSSKPASVSRATHELAQELSVFAASYPVDHDSPPPSPKEIPKQRDRKRKKESKTTRKKRGRASKSSPTQKLQMLEVFPTPKPTEEVCPSPMVEECTNLTPLVSDTSTRACSPTSCTSIPERSLQVVEKRKSVQSRLSLPHDTKEEPVVQPQSHALKTPGMNFSHLEPSANSLENQMTSFLDRIQKTPKPQNNTSFGKTISNLNLLVAKTEEGAVVDLTEDDDENCKLRCGEIVFANLKGLQPWPAVIVMDPEINVCFIPKPEAPNYVHVYFLHLNRRAWVPVENVSVLEDSNYHSETAEMLNYTKYCKALGLAQQAKMYSREQRSLQYSNMREVPMTGASAVHLKGTIEDHNIVVL